VLIDDVCPVRCFRRFFEHFSVIKSGVKVANLEFLMEYNERRDRNIVLSVIKTSKFVRILSKIKDKHISSHVQIKMTETNKAQNQSTSTLPKGCFVF
jgi:hypothetical protein